VAKQRFLSGINKRVS